MTFKNSVSITVSNFGLAAKVLCYMVVIILILGALAACIIVPIGKNVLAKEEIGESVTTIVDEVADYVSGDSTLMQLYGQVKKEASELVQNLKTNAAGNYAGIIITLVAIYILYKFLIGLSFLPLGDILDKFMSSNLKYGFASNMLLNLKSSAKYSAARLLFYIPTDFLFGYLTLLIAIGLNSLIGVFSLPIGLVFGIAMFGLRGAVFSGWIPRYLDNPTENVFKSLFVSFKQIKPRFGKRMGTHSAIYACHYLIMTVLGVATFGISLVFSPSLYHVLTRSAEFVDYYSLNGKRFYTDRIRIVNPVEPGNRKDLINDNKSSNSDDNAK